MALGARGRGPDRSDLSLIWLIRRLWTASAPRPTLTPLSAVCRYGAVTEAAMMADYGIVDLACDDLPRDLVVGSVELYDCLPAGDGFEWCLRQPVRAKELRAPVRHPCPVWFRPW
jgi:hypothetical protein